MTIELPSKNGVLQLLGVSPAISDVLHNQLYSDTKKIGNQVNMVSPSFDGKRIYYTTSLVSNWDMKGEANDQFLKSYNWDGKELKLAFEIDFKKEKLGRAHHMKFQARDLKTLQPLQASVAPKEMFALK